MAGGTLVAEQTNMDERDEAAQGRANLPPYLAGLNDEQLAAVTHTEGCVRVIAGAGTGKTRVLAHRYAYLVESLGIDPADICCVTFTNRAAAEMRRRIRALIGEGNDTSLITTYDSLATRILREDIEKLFWPSSFQILDRDAQKGVLAEVYEDLGLKMDVASFEKVVARVSAVKGDPAYVEALVARERPARMLPRAARDEVDQVVEAYLRRQRRDYLLDFDDLLTFAQHLLDEAPAVRARWQRRLDYVMVDEFQDSSAYELRFVDTLAAGHGNLMVVGDPDQSIYGWRGSDVALLVDFDRTHAPCETLMLTRNYRSTPQVLRCANELIAHNQVRVPKDLVAVRPAGAPVIHLHAESDAAETAWVASRMAQAHAAGMPFSSMAVLYRASFVSQGIERRLMERGIPYEIVGGVRFMQRMEIADTVAYLRLVVYGDDRSFTRVVNTPRRRMGKARVAHLRRVRDEEARAARGAGGGDGGRTLLATLEDHLGDEELRGSGARAFVELIDHLRSRAGDLGVADFVDLVLGESGYETYVRELGSMERLDNLAEFKRMARAFETDAGEAVGLRDFLDALALGADGSTEGDDADRVRLMTIHQAKGLEFPLVFVMGLTEGVFPSARSIEERRAAGLEEERRLCYVALTRARDLLVLTDAEGLSGRRAPKLPSRFLFEMGEGAYERVGTVSPEVERRVRAASAQGTALSAARAGDWAGRRVLHPVFGAGTVVEEDEGGTSWRVDFDGLATPRHLSAAFLARLLEAAEGADDETPAQPTVEV